MNTKQQPTYQELLNRNQYLERQHKWVEEKLIPSWKQEEDDWRNENYKLFVTLDTIKTWCENETMDYKGIVGLITNTFTELGWGQKLNEN